MPSFPIIDTHLHLWDPTQLRYLWLDSNELLNKKYLLGDYTLETKDIEIDKMLFVQCECLPEQCEEEVAWVTRLSQTDKRLNGIVAWAPLEMGEGVIPMLDRYKKNSLVKGIRRIIQFEQDVDFCLSPGFLKGVQLLSKYNYTFDLCVAHYQLSKVAELVSACPDVIFVLDHMGKPAIKHNLTEPWKSQIAQLSATTNVHCKLSGLLTEADHINWQLQDVSEYISWVISCFTPDRIFFGSDWPVLKQAGSFSRWVDTVDMALSELPQDALLKIYRTNAEQFYQLT